MYVRSTNIHSTKEFSSYVRAPVAKVYGIFELEK